MVDTGLHPVSWVFAPYCASLTKMITPVASVAWENLFSVRMQQVKPRPTRGLLLKASDGVTVSLILRKHSRGCFLDY